MLVWVLGVLWFGLGVGRLCFRHFEIGLSIFMCYLADLPRFELGDIERNLRGYEDDYRHIK